MKSTSLDYHILCWVCPRTSTWNSIKTRGEIRCSGRVSISWSACGTRHNVPYVVSRNETYSWQQYHGLNMSLAMVVSDTNVAILTSTIPFSTVISRHLLHMVFTCRSWFNIREPVILIRIFNIDLSY